MSHSVKQLTEFHHNGGLSSVFPAVEKGCWSNQHALLAQQHAGHLAAERLNAEPYQHPESGCVICFWGRIDNRAELINACAQRDQSVPSLSQETDAALVLKAWLKWGKKCAAHLIGDFVFAIVDPQQQAMYCARDHFGVKPLYYQLEDKQLVFGSSLLVFHRSGCCDMDIEQQWLAESLMGVSMSFDKTPYQSIQKLPPGHFLWINRHQQLLQSYYEMADITDLKLKDSREYVDVYQEHLDEAIRCRLDQDDENRAFGSELSGGIDSSTTTVYAAKGLPHPERQLHGFAFATCEMEPEYIHAVSQAIPMAATHVIGVTDPALTANDYVSAVLGYPEEHSNGSGHSAIYQLAQQLGIRVLLSGFGGDEFVTIYSSLGLTELYNKGDYRGLLNGMQGKYLPTRALRLLKFMQREWRKTSSQHLAFNPRFLPNCEHRWQARVLQDHILKEYQLKPRLFAQARFDAGYKSLNEFVLENRWQPFIPTRMENGTLMAATQQIDYRWPLLDVRLVNLFLSIPATEKNSRHHSRWLHRRAIDPYVPHKVTWKRGKDMGQSIKTGNGSLIPFTQPTHFHPQLQPLLAQERVNKLFSTAQQQRGKTPSPASFALNKQCRQLIALDQWLKQVEGGQLSS